MAIRFQCAACSQPIEVDDEWASKAVTCPYCRKAVTAPSESTFDQAVSVGRARSLEQAEFGAGGAASVTGVDAWQHNAPPPPRKRSNGLAAVGLVLSFISVIAAFGYTAISAAHMDELMGLYFEDGERAPIDEVAQTMTERYGGSLPPWMLMIVFISCGGVMAWIAGLVCSIIAVSRSSRRGMAIGGIALAILAPVVICAGGLVMSWSSGPPMPDQTTSASAPSWLSLPAAC